MVELSVCFRKDLITLDVNVNLARASLTPHLINFLTEKLSLIIKVKNSRDEMEHLSKHLRVGLIDWILWRLRWLPTLGSLLLVL